jgi:hypothetical protein
MGLGPLALLSLAPRNQRLRAGFLKAVPATCKELLEPRSASLKGSLLRTLYRKDQALPDRAPAARTSVASRMVPHAQCAFGPIPDTLT